MGAVCAANTVTIRSFAAADAAPCAAIVNATPLWNRYGLDGEVAAEKMASAVDRDEQVLIAESAGVVGFAWWMKRGAFGRSPYLRLIGVAPERRSGGVGGALLSAFEREAAADCFLLVSDFNTGAQRFYERSGYSCVGRLPGFVLPDVEELIYRKSVVR